MKTTVLLLMLVLATVCGQGRPKPPASVFDVTSYGATGNGTSDDTTAIRSALSHITTRGGVLYFPAGVYKYTGPTLVLDKPITVMGDGGGVKFTIGATGGSNGFPALSTIDFNSPTGTLFEVAENGCAFKEIGLRNTSVSTPSSGAGILVSSNGDRTSYQRISVDGFYVDIDVQAGSAQTWDDCWIVAPVLYGLKLRNVIRPDGGDHQISNCSFYGYAHPEHVSGIRIESGGGVKILNNKIIAFQNGIDLAVADGVTTVDLLVSNCSIELCSFAGIKLTTGSSSHWSSILITGNQISPFLPGSPFAIYANGTTPTDLSGVSIVGNVSENSPFTSSSPMISLSNCFNVTISGNNQHGFSSLLQVGNGVTFARSATIPPGGTTGQVLKKLSDADYDTGWQ